MDIAPHGQHCWHLSSSTAAPSLVRRAGACRSPHLPAVCCAGCRQLCGKLWSSLQRWG